MPLSRLIIEGECGKRECGKQIKFLKLKLKVTHNTFISIPSARTRYRSLLITGYQDPTECLKGTDMEVFAVLH